MPTFYLAGLFYMLRQLLSEMDIPARQSYVVSVVSPEERPQAASITSVARLVSSSISPAIAGKILLLPFLSPFVIAGTLKIFYDLTLFFSFKHIKPNEEELQKREEQRVY
jgi:sugar phosphate permease